MTKKWHLIGMIKRIVYRNAGTALFHPNEIFCIFCSLNGTFYLSVEGTHVREISKIFWISAHLLDKFLTLGKRNGFLLLSFNRNFRTFDLAVEGTSVRQ